MAKREILGGGVLLAAGGLIAKETVGWLWTGLLNILTAGMGNQVTIATFPWWNALGVIGMIAGILIIVWPTLRRTFRRATLDEERVLALINDAVKALPALPHAEIENAQRRLDHIESAISQLQTETSILPGLGDALNARLVPIEQTLNTSHIITHRLKREKLQEFQQVLGELTRRHQTELRPQRRLGPNADKDLWGLQSALILAGLPSDELNQEFANIEKHIRGDASYADLKAEDAEKFQTVEEKRMWHIRGRRIDYLKGLLDEMLRLMPTSHDLKDVKIK